jgi:hypothetical protein
MIYMLGFERVCFGCQVSIGAVVRLIFDHCAFYAWF